MDKEEYFKLLEDVINKTENVYDIKSETRSLLLQKTNKDLKTNFRENLEEKERTGKSRVEANAIKYYE
jgi:hypothetical protein